MFFQNLIQHFFKNSEPKYFVGQRLRSNSSKNVLVLKRELFISGIRHYSVSIENGPTKNTELLSEYALRDRKFLPF